MISVDMFIWHTEMPSRFHDWKDLSSVSSTVLALRQISLGFEVNETLGNPQPQESSAPLYNTEEGFEA